MYKMTRHDGSSKGRRIRTKKKGGGGAIYIPSHIVKHIPDDAGFEPEITEDGVLLRFVGFVGRPEVKQEEPAPDAAWLRS